MIREASAPVEACWAIKSCRPSSVVGTSNTNGIDSLCYKQNEKMSVFVEEML